jgi:hypothetical protein
MPIVMQCGSCQRKIRVPDNAAGRTGKCPGCGASIMIPDPDPEPYAVEDDGPGDAVHLGVSIPDEPISMKPKPSPPSSPSWAPTSPPRVVVTGIDMSFGSLVVFMVKLALASVPAAFILWIIMAFLSVIFWLAILSLGLIGGAAVRNAMPPVQERPVGLEPAPGPMGPVIEEPRRPIP